MEIKRLKLQNFKGIQDFEGDFAHVTDIRGKNESGKTTLVDAYHWLLFDKDSNNRTKFDIKPLDGQNNPIPDKTVLVEGEFSFAARDVTLRKELKEKWGTKRGETTREFQGHSTLYWLNDVPKKAKEYQSYIDAMLKEDIFKLISHPLYFSSLNWKQQREYLMAMAPSITDKMIAGDESDYKKLLETVATKETTIDGYKKELAARLTKLDEELERIPVRIDEVQKGMPEEHNWEQLGLDIKEVQDAIALKDEALSNLQVMPEQTAKKAKALQSEIAKLEKEKQDILDADRVVFQKRKIEGTEKKNNLQDELRALTRETDVTIQSLAETQRDIERLNESLPTLRTQWNEINAKQFASFPADKCPTCGTPYNEEKIQEATEKAKDAFNKDKAQRLEELSQKGKKIKKEIEEKAEAETYFSEHIATLKADIKAKQTETEEVNIPNGVEAGEPGNIEKEIQDARKQLDEVYAVIPDDKERKEKLKEEKTELQVNLDILKDQLKDSDRLNEVHARIIELKEQMETVAQDKADVENLLATTTAFMKAKVTAIEDDMNSLFSIVKFKLFADQINGGEQPTCEAMIKGIPWSVLNSASRINAGIDIINTLSRHFGKKAPIWIDNRESTTDIIDTDSQVINLYVDPKEKKLTITHI